MRNAKSWLFEALVMLPALSLVFAVSAAQVFAAADAYPTKIVWLICASEPGSNVDTFARVTAAALEKRLGQKVLVENHAGAGGIIGAELVTKSKPDGYTLLFTSAPYTVSGALRKVPYDPLKSITPIAGVGSLTMLLAVNESVPANSMSEFIALLKKKPGQMLFSTSPGSSGHLNGELFKTLTGTDFKIVLFKSAATATIDVVGGHSHATIITLTVALPNLKSGKLRALATNGSKRSAVLPDVPTFAETGPAGFEPLGWSGILAPAGTPQPIVDRLANEIETVLNTDEMKKFFRSQGAEAAFSGPREFGKFLADDIARWKQVAEKANIKLE